MARRDEYRNSSQPHRQQLRAASCVQRLPCRFSCGDLRRSVRVESSLSACKKRARAQPSPSAHLAESIASAATMSSHRRAMPGCKCGERRMRRASTLFCGAYCGCTRHAWRPRPVLASHLGSLRLEAVTVVDDVVSLLFLYEPPQRCGSSSLPSHPCFGHGARLALTAFSDLFGYEPWIGLRIPEFSSVRPISRKLGQSEQGSFSQRCTWPPVSVIARRNASISLAGAECARPGCALRVVAVGPSPRWPWPMRPQPMGLAAWHCGPWVAAAHGVAARGLAAGSGAGVQQGGLASTAPQHCRIEQRFRRPASTPWRSRAPATKRGPPVRGARRERRSRSPALPLHRRCLRLTPGYAQRTVGDRGFGCADAGGEVSGAPPPVIGDSGRGRSGSSPGRRALLFNARRACSVPRPPRRKYAPRARAPPPIVEQTPAPPRGPALAPRCGRGWPRRRAPPICGAWVSSDGVEAPVAGGAVGALGSGARPLSSGVASGSPWDRRSLSDRRCQRHRLRAYGVAALHGVENAHGVARAHDFGRSRTRSGVDAGSGWGRPREPIWAPLRVSFRGRSGGSSRGCLGVELRSIWASTRASIWGRSRVSLGST